jgi:hypothetical protein
LARNTRPPTTSCKYCSKMGHSSSQCTAKETGTILILHNLLHEILILPTIPVSLVSQLRNHAPPITIQRLVGHYDNFDEESDDDLDKSTTNKASKNLVIEQSVGAPTASFDMEEAEQFQRSETTDYPQSPIGAVTSKTSAGKFWLSHNTLSIT